MIYTPKKYAGNLHLHLERMESGEILKGSVPVGVKKIDEMLIPIAPTDLGVVLANSGHGKCLGKGTKVIMFDGTLKSVEDISVGDQLMGVDSSPRNVLSLARGREQMYLVSQSKGITYRVNKSHILSLTNKKHARMGQCVERCVSGIYSEYCFSGNKSLYGYKAILDGETRYGQDYMFALGVIIGTPYIDGDVFVKDKKCADIVRHVFPKISYRPISGGYLICCESRELLKELNMSLTDIIRVVKSASIDEKTKFLHGVYCALSQFRTDELSRFQLTLGTLIDDIRYIVSSIGHRFFDNHGENYAAILHGIMWCKLSKKKKMSSDSNLSEIKIIEDIIDDYYGFTIDGDSLFLLEDFTVTHNSALMMHMTMNAARLHNAEPSLYAPPIYITRETAIEELLLRMLANFAGINIKELKDNAPFLDWKTIHQQADEMMAEYPVVYIGHSIYTQDNRKMLDTEKAIECVKKVHDSYGAPSILVAVDYLQRFDWVGERDRRLSIARVVEEFKDLALTEKMPLMLGSQAKREVAERPYPVPMATDAMESANVEQTADWMISLMRPCKYWEIGSIIPKSKSNQIVTPDLFYLNVLKQRSGVTNEGTYASFDMRIFSLSSLDL